MAQYDPPPHRTSALSDRPRPRPADAEDAGRAATTTTGGRGPAREPTPGFTAGQAAYVLGFHGVGSLVVSGGVNFGIACAMYLSPSPTAPISLLRLPNTLAGDAALTIIIQLLITWLIEWASVTSDLRSGRVAPLSPSLPPFSTPLARRLLCLPPLPAPSQVREGPASESASTDGEAVRQSESTTGAEKRRPLPAPASDSSGNLLPPPMTLADHLVRIAALLVPSFILFWPPAVGILISLGEKTPGGGDWVYASRWTPQVFKLVLGGLLGLVTTPPMALFWVLRAGERC